MITQRHLLRASRVLFRLLDCLLGLQMQRTRACSIKSAGLPRGVGFLRAGSAQVYGCQRRARRVASNEIGERSRSMTESCTNASCRRAELRRQWVWLAKVRVLI